ncbi:hypothetical protein X777_02819 [Ooceraea biroi]|uniref:Uncharacterized protein n=1 Tax=Ooceraea biroi TaxID=2015173 RepID=A0A026X2A5_OOCBI|nr:hypothetical protein X777_02819 [Ooceraea biroi]
MNIRVCNNSNAVLVRLFRYCCLFVCFLVCCGGLMICDLSTNLINPRYSENTVLHSNALTSNGQPLEIHSSALRTSNGPPLDIFTDNHGTSIGRFVDY